MNDEIISSSQIVNVNYHMLSRHIGRLDKLIFSLNSGPSILVSVPIVSYCIVFAARTET